MKANAYWVAAAWLLISPGVRAVPITFDEPVTPFSGAGQTFQTQGFHFVMGADNTANIATGATWCSPQCPENGTNYLLNLDSGRFFAVTMSLISGELFSLLTFDAAEAFMAPTDYSSATTITVTGIRSDGSTIFDSFFLDGSNDGGGPHKDFQTFALSPPFFNLVSVSFNGSGGLFIGQGNNFYQFFSLDNINMIPRAVPEPSGLILFLTALLLLTAVAPQRQLR